MRLSRTLLKMVLIDLDLQGLLGLKRPKLAKNGLVRTTTHHAFELGSTNLHQSCILGSSRTLLKMVLIDLDLQGHFGVKLNILLNVDIIKKNVLRPRGCSALNTVLVELGLPYLH